MAFNNLAYSNAKVGTLPEQIFFMRKVRMHVPLECSKKTSKKKTRKN